MKIIVIIFILYHYSFNILIGLRIRGLGYVQRFLTKPFIINVFDKKMFYSPSVEGSYDYLLIGKSNEPETHLFLNNIILNLEHFNFVDVGASVGEFVIAVSNSESLKSCYAFEPRQECASVLTKNNQLNNEARVNVYNSAVSDKKDKIKIFLHSGGSSSSQFQYTDHPGEDYVLVDTVILDEVLPKKLENTIILIDIEGAEPEAIKCGERFIATNHPLVIFEYNNTSKKHFKLKDIQALLGDQYSIYRLKGDGSLDQDFSNSWNCVAVPKASRFEEIITSKAA